MATTNKDPVVLRQVGNKKIYLNKSHKLPTYRKNFPFYDQALPRICQQIKNIEHHLTLIDVGANAGDSVSLITDKVDGNFLCVEGDKKYLPLLQKNIKKIINSQIEIEPNFCGDNSLENLTEINQNGTAKLVSSNTQSTKITNIKTLDEIVVSHPKFAKANILKIDTDGFEINVIKGSTNFIKSAKPIIYFEFTPELYKNLKQDPTEIISILNKAGYSSALFYDNFGNPIKIVNLSDIKDINNLIGKIDNQHIYYYDILTFHKTNTQYDQLFIQELLDHTSEVSEYINKQNLAIKNEKQKTSILTDQLKSAQNSVDKLREIYNSQGWKILRHLYQLRDLILPPNSQVKKNLKKINPKKYLHPTYPKIINQYHFNDKAKKIVFIGHSYHAKTKSTEFLLNYLKEYFEVTEVFDDSWNGQSFPDLSFIDDSYLAIIFFQNLPSPEIFNRINHQNLLLFPMYDSYGSQEYDFWKSYQKLKIINFSKTLQDKLNDWRFDSIYIQYFPKPLLFTKNKTHKVFFWQRTNAIDINTVEKLLGNFKTKIHIHQAIDPNCTFVQPTKAQENKFYITYSTWFKTREKMQQKIQECDIYIAPREYEGIGLSFLETMAMGKAVIAADNPTMNEYIINHQTGYLFNINNPKPINFSDLSTIRKNTYNYVKHGYLKWTDNQTEIINFIYKK